LDRPGGVEVAADDFDDCTREEARDLGFERGDEGREGVRAFPRTKVRERESRPALKRAEGDGVAVEVRGMARGDVDLPHLPKRRLEEALVGGCVHVATDRGGTRRSLVENTQPSDGSIARDDERLDPHVELVHIA
jgi:hypothetical protein